MNIKEKIKNTIELVALNGALEEKINFIESYEFDEEGNIICKLDILKLENEFKGKEEYVLSLPTPITLNIQALLHYKNYNINKLKDIVYVIEDANFNKPLIITSYSNIIFSKCIFNEGLEVKGAKSITFLKTSAAFKDAISCFKKFAIKAKAINIYNMFVMYYSQNKNSEMKIDADTICIKSSNISTTFNSLNINGEFVEITSSKLDSKNITINTDELIEKNNRLKASNELIVENRCMTFANENQNEKNRLELIDTLKNIRHNIMCDIKNHTKQNSNNLGNEQIKEFIKK